MLYYIFANPHAFVFICDVSNPSTFPNNQLGKLCQTIAFIIIPMPMPI